MTTNGSVDAGAGEIAAIRARLHRPRPGADAAEPERTSQFVVFQVGGVTRAIAAANVRGIDRAPAVTPVPLTPAYVVGVYNLRGTLQPVLDLSAFLRGERSTNRYVVNVVAGELAAALLVDAVDEVVAWPESLIEVVAPRSSGAPAVEQFAAAQFAAAHFVAAQFADGRRIVPILDAHRLLRAAATDVEQVGR